MRLTSFRKLLVATACALALPAFSAHGDDTSRINFLESEIQRLRTQLAEQNRRILRLEAQLEQRTGVATPDPETILRAAAPAGDKPPVSGPLPWHSAEAWQRLAIGMSQQDVTEILGEPTAVEAVDNYKTLFYSDGAAGGAISGHVNFKDSLVVAIKKPASR